MPISTLPSSRRELPSWLAGIAACGCLVVACSSTSSFGGDAVLTIDGGPDGTAAAEADASGVSTSQGDAKPDADPPPAPSRLVLFGGFVDLGGAGYLGDTWEWNGTSWAQRANTGPSGRVAAALSALNGKAILFGGYDGTTLGDTWEWDGTTWKSISAAGPSARFSAAIASVGGKVILFGGNDPTNKALGDTWEWDGAAWSMKTITGPSARGGAAMTVVDGKAVLFGGDKNERDTWEWDGSAWRELATTSAIWRSAHSMATLDGKALVVGGIENGGCYSDVLQWDGAVWNLEGALDPSRCGGTAATFGAYVLLFGGSGYPYGLSGGHQYMDETWTWDGAAWSKRLVAGPPGRDRQMMVTF